MEIQVVYCYVAVDSQGKEQLMGVAGPDNGLATPLIALTEEQALEMEPAIKEIIKKVGLSYRLKSFSSPKIVKDYSGFS